MAALKKRKASSVARAPTRPKLQEQTSSAKVKRPRQATSRPAPSVLHRSESEASDDEDEGTGDEDGHQDEADDFDDGEDLLANAMTAGATNGARTDESQGSDDDDDDDQDDDEDDDDDDDYDQDEEHAQAPQHDPPRSRDDVTMYSDEDMDGGFEDLEGVEQDPELAHGDDQGVNGSQATQQQAAANYGQGTSAAAEATRKKTAALYSVPSTKEVEELRGATDLFGSNLFKLKMDQLLPNLRPKSKSPQLELVLHRIKSALDDAPSIDAQPLASAIKELRTRLAARASLHVPFCEPQPRPDGPLKFGFQPPARIDLVGSWPLGLALKRPADVDVDVALTMPSSLFTDKDHLNHRYAHKRAFYLAAVAAVLLAKQDELDVDVAYQLLADDPRRPVLVLRPRASRRDVDFHRLRAVVRLHLAREQGVFAPARLAPSRNSVRLGPSRSGEENEGGEAAPAAAPRTTSQPPTPTYNAAVLADELYLPHLLFLHGVARQCAAFADACLLLKLWAFHRGFGEGEGASRRVVGGVAAASQRAPPRHLVYGTHRIRFVLTMVMAHLLRGEAPDASRGASASSSAASGGGKPKLLTGFSAYQLFRGTIDWLAHEGGDLCAHPSFMRHSAELPHLGAKVSREDFARRRGADDDEDGGGGGGGGADAGAGDCVLVDPTGCVNLLAGVPATSWGLLRSEARQTLAALQDTGGGGDHFEALFMRPRSAPAFRFDECATLRVPGRAGEERRGGGGAREAGSRNAKNGATPAANDDGAGVEQEEQHGKARRRAQEVDLGSWHAHFAHGALATLRAALDTRAKLVALLTPQPAPTSWDVKASGDARTPTPASRLELGVALLPAPQSLRLVQHGPPPDDVGAVRRFRALWGELAELRRFRDGRIVESVVWSCAAPAERAEIPRRIVRHVLARHHGVGVGGAKSEGGRGAIAASPSFLGDGFSSLLEVPASVSKRAYLSPPSAKGFQLVQSAFETLSGLLRAADELPLSVVNVTPASAALRSMSTFVPPPLRVDALGVHVPSHASHLAAHDVVVQVEGSGNWPDDLAAIQATKMALYDRLADSLRESTPGLRARVAMDADAESWSRRGSMADVASLEVVLPTGFAFRARIHHERERVLLERILASRLPTNAATATAAAAVANGRPLPGATNAAKEARLRQERAREALARHRRRFHAAVRHHALLAALQHRHAALGEAARLLKRWCSAQMFGNHVGEELLELVCADAFVSPASGGGGTGGGGGDGAPTSGVLGFLRALRRLATWAWREEPMLVAAQTAVDLSERDADDAAAAADDAETTNDGDGGGGGGGGSSGSRRNARRRTDASVARFPAEARARAERAFEAARRADPTAQSLAWFVATDEVDDEAAVEARRWAHTTPSASVADALQRRAQACCAVLEAQPVLDAASIKKLFMAPLTAFDLVFRLDARAVNRYVENIDYDAASVGPSSRRAAASRGQGDGDGDGADDAEEDLVNVAVHRHAAPDSAERMLTEGGPQVGLDTGLETVKLLQTLLGGGGGGGGGVAADVVAVGGGASSVAEASTPASAVQLFYDVHGGTAVGAVLNPSLALTPRSFRVLARHPQRPPAGLDADGARGGEGVGAGEASKGKVVLDVGALADEAQRLGEGVVTRVEVRETSVTAVWRRGGGSAGAKEISSRAAAATTTATTATTAKKREKRGKSGGQNRGAAAA